MTLEASIGGQVPHSIGLYVWTFATLAVALSGLVLAAKGRWGWLLIGVVLIPLMLLAWPFIACQPARPGSLWHRLITAKKPGAGLNQGLIGSAGL